MTDREETLRDETGFPTYTVRVWDPPEAWRTTEGAPGFVEWAVYEVQGTQEPDVSVYWRKGAVSNVDPTRNVEDAEHEARGSVKWDGCCNFEVGSPGCLAHVCDIADLTAFTDAIRRAYVLSCELLGGDAVEYGLAAGRVGVSEETPDPKIELEEDPNG
jgi:hypothetical protein